MDFRITGLDSVPFQKLYGLNDELLATFNAARYVVDKNPGFPERIEMRDGEVGESFLLINYQHQPADTPYRSSHAIFIREGAVETYDRINEIPDVLLSRHLAVRGFDSSGMLVEAELVEGKSLKSCLEKLLANPDSEYLHVHFAAHGCYAAKVERA